jgi:hypothetical protein
MADLPRIPPRRPDGHYPRADALEKHLEASKAENEQLKAENDRLRKRCDALALLHYGQPEPETPPPLRPPAYGVEGWSDEYERTIDYLQILLAQCWPYIPKGPLKQALIEADCNPHDSTAPPTSGDRDG